jgi:hypothetical protein
MIMITLLALIYIACGIATAIFTGSVFPANLMIGRREKFCEYFMALIIILIWPAVVMGHIFERNSRD